MFDKVIDELNATSIGVGEQMTQDAEILDALNTETVELQQAWMGKPQPAPSTGTPDPNAVYTTNAILAELKYWADKIAGETDSSKITQDQQEAQAWSTVNTVMGSIQDMQKQPLSNATEAESSQIQTDNQNMNAQGSVATGINGLNSSTGDYLSGF